MRAGEPLDSPIQCTLTPGTIVEVSEVRGRHVEFSWDFYMSFVLVDESLLWSIVSLYENSQPVFCFAVVLANVRVCASGNVCFFGYFREEVLVRAESCSIKSTLCLKTENG